MLRLVREARRRLFCNELLSQGANAISVAMAAFILLLLFGAQLLNWQWLVLIPLAALAAGVYLARRRVPAPYAVAQMIDRNLRLADTLSTAFYFQSADSRRKASESMRCLQLEAAEEVSKSIDIRAAVPYSMPRTAYLMAALVLVASSLFALRYGLNRRLDLRPPLARIVQQSFGFPERAREANRTKQPLPPQPAPEGQDEESVLSPEQITPEDAQKPEDAPPETLPGRSGKAGKKESLDNQSKQQDQAEPASAEDPEGQQSGQPSNDASNQSGKDGKQDGSKQNAARQDSNTQQSSLLSKVKDAMQNLFSRMKTPPNQSGSQQSSQEQNSKQGNGQQSGKQESAKNGQQQASGQQAGDQEGQAGEQSENSQDPQGKGSGKNNSQQANKQPGNGIGSQDGDKSIRQAEQLAAMGKISEIIGKRAANISGETTVEVQNTSQVLHTQYTQRGAQHSQAGTEIHRDEVPVALEGFVEQYFEQVRKQAPPKK